MRHPPDGTLRRLLDEPAGVTDRDRDHVTGCATCAERLAGIRAEAQTVGAALAVPASAAGVGAAPDVDAAWRRLAGRLDRDGTAAVRRPRRDWRAALRSPAAAFTGAVLLVGGAGAAATTDWFQIFRTEEVAPLTLTQADVIGLPDLSDLGTVRWLQEPSVREVADAAAAERATGIALPEPDELPRGVEDRPTVHVGEELQAVFTFSTEEAGRVATAAGRPLPEPPAGMDGAQFRLSAGPGVASVWRSGQGAPALVVIRGVAPTGASSGLDFDTARDYLLGLPGLPEDLTRQLGNLSVDGSTLPLPFPESRVETTRTEVGGLPATTFALREGVVAGVVWVEDGLVTVVAGTVGVDEVVAVARGLR